MYKFSRIMFSLVRQFSFLLLILLLIQILIVQGQSSKSDKMNWGIPERPFNCEINYSYLEQVRDMIKGQMNPNGVLILIARLGDGEKRFELNHRRLYNVRVKLNSEFDVEAEKIIVVQGERVKGFGRIEFYLSGELIGTLLVKKNGDICVGCCGPDERFYPYKAELKRKQKPK